MNRGLRRAVVVGALSASLLAGTATVPVAATPAGQAANLSKLKAHPEMLPESIPLFRLEDTGMGIQMQEYAVSQVLHWFRRFDDYQALQRQSNWQPLPDYTHEEFSVGIMGAGVLGSKVAESLLAWGFPVRCRWSTARPWSPQFASGWL